MSCNSLAMYVLPPAERVFRSAKAALYQLESFMLQGDDTKVHDVRMKHLGSALHMSVSSISETIRAFIQLDIAKYLPVSA